MKPSNLNRYAYREYTRQRAKSQVKKTQHTGKPDSLNHILTLAGYTVGGGEIAGRVIPLFIERRAA